MRVGKRFLAKFSMFDLILLALTACLGVVSKPLVVPLAHIITGPLYIPGGVIAGGFYMMWIVLGAGLVRKAGTGTIIAVVQAIMVIALGIYGTHGLMSLFTYVLPGIAVDVVMLIYRYKSGNVGCCFLSGIAANASGTFLVNLVFFRLPVVPLILSVSSASLSGGLGGLIAYGVIKQFEKSNLGRFIGRS